MRNPKRTARTAASLMIGVALVGFITVFAASAKTSLAGSLETDFTGTHIVETGGWDNSVGLSPELADELRATPGVDVVSQARTTPAIVDGSATDFFSAFDATTVDEVFALGSVEGDLDSLGDDGIAVSAEEATSKGWTLGSDGSRHLPRWRHDARGRGDLLGFHRLGRPDVRRPRGVACQRR